MGRKRIHQQTAVPNLFFEPRDGSFRYKHPHTGKSTMLGRDQAGAEEVAQEANLRLMKNAAGLARILGTGDRTVAQVIQAYREKCLPYKAWDTGTRENAEYLLRVYEREHGDRLLRLCDRVWLAEQFDGRCQRNETYNRHRDRWADLYAFAIARGYATVNEAAATLKRSLSKKLEANQKVRRRLELNGYLAIYNHEDCPAFLRLAMPLSLITLQARREIVGMGYADRRGGRLYVIRDKTSAESDMAFIKIKVKAPLAAVIQRSRQDGVLSPFIVHRAPLKRRRKELDKKAHWTAVAEDYLTRAFARVRDATGHWDGVPERERPTFHEIRSLGGRIYIKLGYPRAYVQRLMTHTDPKTTEIYLSGGKLAEADYIEVEADLDPKALTDMGDLGLAVDADLDPGDLPESD